MGVDETVHQIAAWVVEAERTLVFTGAGISTESGIPDFRGPNGLWKKVDPKLFTIQNYVADPEIRKRSWRARLDSEMFDAEPNTGHVAIARLEALGVAPIVVTQNIDGLHQAAGSTDVIEVHGSVREFVCLDCAARGPIEDALERVRGGEADPACPDCGGILKTATISFGQNLETDVIERAFAEAEKSDLCIAAGSSLSVTPAAHIPRIVGERGRLVIVNAEPTDLDFMAAALVSAQTGTFLPALADAVEALLAERV
ncbi:MAG: NAD-dependent protein deacylase [Acidimicrobiia bacterium]|nr:NAD-dependent protein deacylase [Acidimicrobiia bacterium]